MAKNGKKANSGFEAKLWLATDKLRNSMDAAEYKHVVPGLIFLKHISDSFEEHRAKLVGSKGEKAIRANLKGDMASSSGNSQLHHDSEGKPFDFLWQGADTSSSTPAGRAARQLTSAGLSVLGWEAAS